jgi:hypothetical protein
MLKQVLRLRVGRLYYFQFSRCTRTCFDLDLNMQWRPDHCQISVDVPQGCTIIRSFAFALPDAPLLFSGTYHNSKMRCLFRDPWAESWLGNLPRVVYIYLFWLQPRYLGAHQNLNRRPFSVKVFCCACMTWEHRSTSTRPPVRIRMQVRALMCKRSGSVTFAVCFIFKVDRWFDIVEWWRRWMRTWCWPRW